MTPVQCPECKGTGRKHLVFVKWAPEATEEDKKRFEKEGLRCEACRGTGMIDYDYEARQKAGWRFQEHRIMRNMTMRELSKRTGIPAHIISEMCCGIREPDFTIFDRLGEENADTKD